MFSETFLSAIRHDSFCAGYNHADQGHEMDLFRGQFDAPEDYQAWIDGWVEGHHHGPHQLGHPDPAAAEAAWQLYAGGKAVA